MPTRDECPHVEDEEEPCRNSRVSGQDRCDYVWWSAQDSADYANGQLPVVLPGERVGSDGVSERTGEMDAQSSVDREQPGVEGHACKRRAESWQRSAASALRPWPVQPWECLSPT